jgi:hypothetical protein
MDSFTMPQRLKILWAATLAMAAVTVAMFATMGP